MKVRIAETAWQDLEDIAIWVGRDSPTTALRLYDTLVDAAEAVVPMPGRFALVEGLENLGLRRCSVPPYLIIFRIEDEAWVSVLRVVHDARDLPRLFGD